MRDILGADTCAVLLLDEATNELVARAACGLEEEVEQRVRIPLNRGFAGRVAGERRVIAIDDLDRAEIVNPILREKDLKSLLGAPLLAGDRVLGVIHVGTRRPHVFTRDEIELLELAASRAALAIDHGRLFAAEHALAERLRKLQLVTDAALAHLSLDDLLDELLVRVQEILSADTCAVLLVDEARKELVAQAARGLEEEVEQGLRLPIGHGFAGRIAAERHAVALENVGSGDVLSAALRAKGITSLLGAPLLARDRVLGVILVGMLRPHDFTQDDVELLSIAAERAALGLEKALIHEELIRLDRMRHQFVSIASHELRTPASAILGAAETLEKLGSRITPELERQLRHMLLDQTRRLVTLLEQLLDISRLEARAGEIRPERFNVARRTGNLAESVAAADGAAVQVDVPPNLEVYADPLAFDRIVSNLIVNATRHGAPPVTVSAAARDRHLNLVVEDRGDGVPDEFRARLFEQFTRGAKAVGKPGSGLGLAIARSYARAHGGDLVYEDAAPQGARFRLLLPLEQG